jgi:8-oxo-dGTP pyrophosphatase MutT (NUDIX family)
MPGDRTVKVTAYIMRGDGEEKKMLVFAEQGFEHLGFQVPGGTVEPGESLLDAVVREVMEEAGLAARPVRLLGDHSYFSEAHGQHMTRYYYEMESDCPEERFTHVVQSGDEDNGWIYHYEWVRLIELEKLHGYLGVYLDKVIR